MRTEMDLPAQPDKSRPIPLNYGSDNPSRIHWIIRAMRHRNYRLFFAGQIISLCGTFMTQTAMIWLVYHITNSGKLLGITAFAGQIPAFLLGPFAGVWVDRLNRRRLIVMTQILAMVQSFALAALVIFCTAWGQHQIGVLVGGLISLAACPGTGQCLRYAGPAGVSGRNGDRAK